MYRNELFYRSLFAESLDGVLLVNPEGIIGFVSPSIRNILGYDPDEISGRNVFEFVHPEDSEWAIASFKREVMENPEIKFIVVRVRKKSGEWLWCMVRGHNLLKNPNVNSIVIYLHDDTLRKKAIEALKESEQRFRKLVQDLQFGVVMQDNQGRVIMCNNALLDILHLNEQELTGKTIAETLDEVILENGKAATENDMPLYIASRTKKTAKNSVIGIKSLRFSNRKWLLVSSSPILDEHEELKHVICTITDITERKNLEQTLLHKKIEHQKHVTQATIDAQENERREIGKELHDNIGQQLTTTKLYLEIAKTTADEDTLEMIDLALNKISDVINEVRDISRALVPPTIRDLGLIESLADLTESLSKTEYLKVKLVASQFNEEKLPENEKLMLYRIVQEQLNNIVKHAQAKTVTITLKNDKPILVLQISDDGKGFNPVKANKGLGLANIKNRAELFGGKVHVISSEGEGCTLKVIVPSKS